MLVFFLILQTIGVSAARAAPAGPQLENDLVSKNILILHSHEANAPVFVETDLGLSRSLRSGGVPLLNQFYESLELRRYPLQEHRKQLADQLRLRYGNRQVDMIITMYPEALEFLLNELNDTASEAPILALYLPPGYQLPKTGRHIVTHAPSLDIGGTFEIAMTMVPEARRVYVVSGAHPVDRMREIQARQLLREWESRFDFCYLSDMHFQDILAALADAPPDSIVLLLIFSQDIGGKSYLSPDLTQKLSQVSKAPIFGLLKSALGHGIVGGFLINFEDIGMKAGELSKVILGSAAPGRDLPQNLDAPSVPMFDWQQLERWELNTKALPRKAVIINREFTLWDLKYYLFAAVAFLLAQSFLILMLLQQKRRRKSAEVSLRQKTDELDRFFSVSLELLCIANTSGFFVRLNPAWEKMLGYTRDELMQKRFLEFVHPDDQAATQQIFEKLIANREVTRFENRYCRKDGSYRFLDWSAVPAGNLIYAAARDITERMEEEKAARRRRDEFAHLQRVATMGELTASLAHEINQPLTAIMSNAQAAERFLKGAQPDLEEIKAILHDIIKEDARAAEVISRLRSLLKKEKADMEPLDLNSVFQEVVLLLHSDAVIRDVRLSLKLDPRLPRVQGDRIQLQQVALNLLMNAFEAVNERPRGERRVNVETCVKEGRVLVRVSDNGPGVRSGDSEKLFQPFYTTKNQGLGMGLSISRSIILRHEGWIWAEPGPAAGATFSFNLPAAADET